MPRPSTAIFAAAFVTATAAGAHAADLKPIIVAEPIHGIGYLPLYIAVDKGFFAREGLDAKIITIESGSGHTNAVLSGQAFAFIGGPEHDAYAKIKGAELRSVVNVVDRGNVYFDAAVGRGPKDKDFPGYFKGKVIEAGVGGGTPNSITRYLLGTWGLDTKKDVTLLESTVAGTLAAVKVGQATIANSTEPTLTQGIRQGIWEEPFYSVPKEMGPYAYSTLNVRLDSIQKDPATVRAFVKAVIEGLEYTYAHPDEASAIAAKEFPTMPPEDVKATLDRTFADQLWSRDGSISRQSWATAEKVVRGANIWTQDVAYDDIIDTQFVPAAHE
jgi:NitT/TauT family transport system substrate-binding protein